MCGVCGCKCECLDEDLATWYGYIVCKICLDKCGINEDYEEPRYRSSIRRRRRSRAIKTVSETNQHNPVSRGTEIIR